MRKTILKVVTLAALVGCCRPMIATTGELRTPISRFPYHYPLNFVDDGQWSLNFFSDIYVRTADKGFDSDQGIKKVPLSQLFFGKSDFKGEEVFYGGSVSLDPDSIQSVPSYLKYITMKPRFKYSEKGANFGVDTEYRYDDSKWRFGGSASIPFKVIELERNVCSATMTDQEELKKALDGIVCRKPETLTPSQTGVPLANQASPTEAIAPAYRLDFLSSLCQANGMPMVEYGNSFLRIAGLEVSLFKVGGAVIKPTVVALHSNIGCPVDKFSSPDTTADGIEGVISRLNANYIAANGSIAGPVAADPNRAPFISNIDYTGLGQNTTALSELFVVPVYQSNMLNIDQNTRFHNETVIIMNAVEEAISDLYDNGAQQAEQFFYNNGIHFCQTEKNIGLGDLMIDGFVGYDITEKYWAKLIAGVVLPTGKKICDPGLLLSQPTGNNGHFEGKIGLQLGGKRCKWFGLTADVSYNYVFQATEWRGAAFKGATVKNIGPKIQADVKWDYFTGHIDLSIFHPENQNFGFSIGYEAYVKRSDKIKFCGPCTGNNNTFAQLEIKGACGGGDILNAEAKELDPCVMVKDTKRISHKVRGEVFHRWNYCELFAGLSHVVAGKNIMKETEAHLGFGIFW